MKTDRMFRNLSVRLWALQHPFCRKWPKTKRIELLEENQRLITEKPGQTTYMVVVTKSHELESQNKVPEKAKTNKPRQ
jgi:hypothetical protein